MRGDPFAPVRGHIAAARRRAGFTQSRLAEEADVSLDFVKNLETRRKALIVPGDTRSPDDYSGFARVCRALGEDPLAILRAYGMLREETPWASVVDDQDLEVY